MSGNQNQQQYQQNDPQQWGQEQYHAPQRAVPTKKKKKWLPWVIGGGVVILIFSAMGGGNSGETTSVSNPATSTTTAPAKVESQAPAEPAMVVSSGTMINELESNALKAKQTYEGKRVTVSGYVGNIDASGKYFTIDPKQNDFILTGIQVYTQTEEHKSQLAELSKNESVTVTGEVTGVGEIMGYSIDIESIN